MTNYIVDILQYEIDHKLPHWLSPSQRIDWPGLHKAARAKWLAKRKQAHDAGFDPNEPRDKSGEWSIGGSNGPVSENNEPSTLRERISHPRKPWTLERIKQELKGLRSDGKAGFWREVSMYDSPEALENNLYYHGTASGFAALKAGVALPKDAFRSGGYGDDYYVISLSKSKNVASNFTGDKSYGNVYTVVLKKGAKVISIPGMEDASELEDILPELWMKGIDAVKLSGGEQELAVLNPRAIALGPSESFQVFQKKKFLNPTNDELVTLIDTAKKERARILEKQHDWVVKHVLDAGFDPNEPRDKSESEFLGDAKYDFSFDVSSTTNNNDEVI